MDNISFNIDTTEVIPEILNKYGLKDGNEEMLEELEKDEVASIIPGEIILNLAIKVAKNEVPIKDMPAILASKLKLPRATVDLLAKDIQEKIISNAKIITLKDEEEKKEAGEVKEADSFPNIKPPIGVAEALERNTAIKESEEKTAIPQKKIDKIINKPTVQEAKESTPKSKQPKKQDTYREPIE